MVIDSFLSIKAKLNSLKRSNCFELLGYDFMIDEDLRVWMIEINQNPSVFPMSEVHEVYMKTMVLDLFDIVVDPILNIQKTRETKK
jgi:D-alanine-D-alanine ligase-like ATP-grasp enzyme